MKTEWKTIDSAPKDKKILVYTANGYIEIGSWNDDEYANKPSPYWESTGPWGKRWQREHPPKYWMPLPEPPKP